MSASKCDWCKAPVSSDDVWPVIFAGKQVGVACCATCQEELEHAERDHAEYQYECGVGAYWRDFE